ncbi:MAG: glycosyltransferase [Flavisolibacter sp.]|nr:glycosyltransferase [Flavisolibacter sp.]MBD0284158.1 glycosyltransferase [Flavisolibacter sp.]MBD0297657.1 glycosyltransferase [Flavisolibacter sp.]MBD0365062.1 glycosyltransferase [Flavisolibacter sp.]
MDDRIPAAPPVILSIEDGEERPLWSVMIPTFNCIHYLRQTLSSVLTQDPGAGNMQIEVIDDCSTDGDVGALVQAIGKGRVGFFRQEKNRGSLRNFETCLNRSRGKWVHILHGDDCVKPGFYQEIEHLFNSYPSVGAAFTKHSVINERGYEIEISGNIIEEPGIVKDWLYKIAQEVCVQPPAIVVKRSVYEHLGGFFAVHYGEDWEMWTRIAAHYPVAYSPKCLAMYRRHSNNISTRAFLSGQNTKDVMTVMNIIQSYLPRDKRRRIRQQALRTYSIYFIKKSYYSFDEGKNVKAALRQATNALKMHVNKITVYNTIKLYILYMLRRAVKENSA